MKIIYKNNKILFNKDLESESRFLIFLDFSTSFKLKTKVIKQV